MVVKNTSTPPTATKHNMDTHNMPDNGKPVMVLKKKKKRNKLVKSCTFCRKRKMKCDQNRPRCSTCVSRNMQTCEYSEALGKQNPKTKNIIPASSKKGDGISSTNRVMQLQCGPDSLINSHIFDSNEKDSINPFNDQFLLQTKDSGRRYMHGPTSLRTSIVRNNWSLVEKYGQLWYRVKLEKNKWRSSNKFSMLNEALAVELDGQEPESDDNITDTLPADYSPERPANLVDRICSVLPSYESCKSIISSFFDSSELYEISDVLCKNRITADFYSEFHPQSSLLPNGERKLELVKTTLKRNFYKVGVLLSIICITHYREHVPLVIRKFFVMVNGFTTARVFYLERLHYLLLQYYYRQLFTPCGDETHMINLADMLSSTAITMGLYLNIDKLYHNQESAVGALVNLKKLWIWVLYVDYHVALEAGRPLGISLQLSPSNDPIYDDPLPGYKFYRQMAGFLKLARPMIDDFYIKDKRPDLKSHTNKLRTFFESELGPLSNYTDRSKAKHIPLSETRIGLSVLSAILMLNNARVIVLGENKMKLNNGMVKFISVSLVASTNLIDRCFALDKEFYPEYLNPRSKLLPPYMTLALSYVNTILPRASSCFFTVVHHKIMLFETGLLPKLSHDRKDIVDCNLDDLECPSTKRYSMIQTFDKYISPLKDWLDAQTDDVKMIMGNWHGFSINIALERVRRMLLEKVKELLYKTKEQLQAKGQWGTSRRQKRPDGIATQESLETLNGADISNEEDSSSLNRAIVVSALHELKNGMDSVLRAEDVDAIADNKKTGSPVNLALASLARIPESFSTPMGMPVSTMPDNTISLPDILSSATVAPSEAYSISTTIPEQEYSDNFDLNALMRDPEMAQAISDEFWNSYKDEWELLLNDADYTGGFDEM